MWDGSIGRIDGFLLLLCFLAYLFFQLLEGRRSREIGLDVEMEVEEYTESLDAKAASRTWFNIGTIVLASLLLVIGAELLVKNAIHLSRLIGISERVIGLTIVAFGTSLPELATSVVAAMRKEADIAIGNIVGSNIFNILLIIGSVTILKPLSFDAALLSMDGPFMLVLTFVMMMMLIRGRPLRYWQGGVLLLAAVGYTVKLFY
jgi:cation:H+ antiporter